MSLSTLITHDTVFAKFQKGDNAFVVTKVANNKGDYNLTAGFKKLCVSKKAQEYLASCTGLEPNQVLVVDERCVYCTSGKCSAHRADSDIIYVSVRLHGPGYPFVPNANMKDGKESLFFFEEGEITGYAFFETLKNIPSNVNVVLLAISRDRFTPEVQARMVANKLIHYAPPKQDKKMSADDTSVASTPSRPAMKLSDFATIGKKGKSNKVLEEAKVPDNVLRDNKVKDDVSFAAIAAKAVDADANSDDEETPVSFKTTGNKKKIKDFPSLVQTLSAEATTAKAEVVAAKAFAAAKTEPIVPVKSITKSLGLEILGVTLVDDKLEAVWDFPGAAKMFDNNGLAPYNGKMVSFLVPK